jgi:putative hydrolase of the HAD superfamily
LGLRAVVFDYGMVLSGPPDAAAYAEMVRTTGLDRERFEQLYWSDRAAYDIGAVTGHGFWRNLVRDAGLNFDTDGVERLCQLDARHWTTQNLEMLAWQQKLKDHGLKTGILSNMGDSVLESIQREFDWLARFDVLVWSFKLHLVKPDPAIYRHLLRQLGTEPGETLFIDDREVNVHAARMLGIQSIEFSNIDRLRADLIALGLDRELPLP